MRLIDADEMKKNFQDELCGGVFCDECAMQEDGFCRAERWVDIQPTIEAEPVKHGRWDWYEEFGFGNPYGTYRCSVCGNAEPHKTNYCCYCGADMREVEDESERQGKYCIECANSSTCYGAGLEKTACKSFKPRVRYANCEETNGE